MNNCPVCNKRMVVPSGPDYAKVLVLLDKPDHEEVQSGHAFSGRTGDMLRIEMGRVGLQLQQMRVSTVWKHAIPGKKDPNLKGCRDAHLHMAIKEMREKELVLLCGAASSEMFDIPPISSVSSLQVESPFFRSGMIVIASSHPAMAISARHGELRLALTRFKEVYEEVVA